MVGQRPTRSRWGRAARAISLCGAAVWSVACAAPGRAAPPDPVATAIGRIAGSGWAPGARWPSFPDVGEEVRRLYARTGSAPLWSERGAPTRAALGLIEAFEGAADLGLSPTDFDAASLRSRAQLLRNGGPAATAGELAAFDVVLTVDALRFVSALHHGRVSPRAVHATLELPRPPFDAAAVVDSLRRAGRPEPILEALQPPFLHYRLLRQALVRYRALARDTGLVPLPRLASPLKPGARYRGAARVRRLLVALGDLPAGTGPEAAADTVYDDSLAAAVARFQRRHGFTADGVVGTMTERGLDQPFGERIRQIELTLERWRWLPRPFDAPPILVNVPAFRLYAFRSASDRESDLLAMNVQVGQAYEHRTPLFAARLRYLVFRPYWEVTPSIARKEIGPKARRDPGYLARERLELVRGAGDGEVLAPTPENIRRIGVEVRVRQRPGPGNALGDVKFIFPNEHNVYMHDTPARGQFERARRDFSHGCIRLGRPLDLAAFVLRDQRGWSRERIQAAVDSDRPTQVNLDRPVPVHILYGTAMARENGEVLFYPDLYEQDLTLDLQLQRGFPQTR